MAYSCVLWCELATRPTVTGGAAGAAAPWSSYSRLECPTANHCTFLTDRPTVIDGANRAYIPQ